MNPPLGQVITEGRFIVLKHLGVVFLFTKSLLSLLVLLGYSKVVLFQSIFTNDEQDFISFKQHII